MFQTLLLFKLYRFSSMNKFYWFVISCDLMKLLAPTKIMKDPKDLKSFVDIDYPKLN